MPAPGSLLFPADVLVTTITGTSVTAPVLTDHPSVAPRGGRRNGEFPRHQNGAHVPVRRIMPVHPCCRIVRCRVPVRDDQRCTDARIGPTDRHVGSGPRHVFDYGRRVSSKQGRTKQGPVNDAPGPAWSRGRQSLPAHRRVTTIVGASRGMPNINMRGLAKMSQMQPVSTRLLYAWENAWEDNQIDSTEAKTLTTLIEDNDDGTRLALSVLKGGASTRRAHDGLQEFTALHGPIDFQAQRNARTAEDDPSAA